jgi:hypothetical protein
MPPLPLLDRGGGGLAFYDPSALVSSGLTSAFLQTQKPRPAKPLFTPILMAKPAPLACPPKASPLNLYRPLHE